MSIIQWDPRLHPRNRFGRFRDVVQSLQPGDMVEMPDRTRVLYGASSRKYMVQRPDGRMVNSGTPTASPAEAVRQALDATAQGKHPDSLGGPRSFDSLQMMERAERTVPGQQVARSPGTGAMPSRTLSWLRAGDHDDEDLVGTARLAGVWAPEDRDPARAKEAEDVVRGYLGPRDEALYQGDEPPAWVPPAWVVDLDNRLNAIGHPESDPAMQRYKADVAAGRAMPWQPGWDERVAAAAKNLAAASPAADAGRDYRVAELDLRDAEAALARAEFADDPGAITAARGRIEAARRRMSDARSRVSRAMRRK